MRGLFLMQRIVEAGRRGTSVSIQIAVRCVIGVLVAPVVIAATEPEASAAMKVITAEVAAHLGMLTRKAATERRATTGEMASAEPAAHAGAAAEPAHVRAAAEPAPASAAEPAHASAAEPAHVSATHVAATEPAAHMSATPETPAVSTPTTVSTAEPPAARERISGQSPGESGSRRQNDHSLA
jgi:hypothetical protein